MIVEKKHLSEKNYRIEFPFFAPTPEDHRKRRNPEAAMARRMNRFYESVLAELTKNCGTLPPKAYCTVETGWSMGETGEITVTMLLSLRNRPAPTRRRTICHTWRKGYLAK